MRPFLFSIGSYQVPSFFFFIMIATLAVTMYWYWLAGKKGLRQEVILDMGMLGMLAAIIGSRIFHILVEAPDYYWEKPSRVFEFWRGGFVSWGACIGIVATFFVYFRVRQIPLLPYLDSFAASSPIIKFFVRLACLLTGCCYGQPTNLPWAITFTNPNSTAHYFYPNTPLHPVQIYSMVHAALLFVFMNWFYRKRGAYPGETMCVLVMGWALPRAIIEFWRADSDRGLYFNNTISTGQVMGILAFLTGLILYLIIHVRYKKREANAD